MVTWANPPLPSSSLCAPWPVLSHFGAGQRASPTIYVGGNYLDVAIPVLTDTAQGWLIQLWENPLSLGSPTTRVNKVSPANVGIPGGVSGIPARTNNVADEASSVNMKLLALTQGAVALVDWVGNTRPSRR